VTTELNIEREIVKELGVYDKGQGKHDKACIYFEKGNILVMDQSNGSFRGKKIVGAPFH
jgi:hypothetical protein